MPAASAIPALIIIDPRDGATEAFEPASASGATCATLAAVDAAAGLLKDLPA
ncbi:hypothetical protein [uncultured Jatrophihabitans sp.]|uniref:hypothetical protein n=1 Tax=uncultured Jatrophihabitans sp. TaxID=1610747 RepID=UPI0035C95439